MLSLIASTFSCGKAETGFTKTFFALDTVITFTIYKEEDLTAVSDAIEETERYEKIFSRTREDSELYQLNHAAGKEITVSEELFSVLEKAYDFSARSEGLFDFTLGGISSLYDFGSENPKVPDEEILREALTHVGYEKVHLLSGNRVRIDDPMTVIDLGAVAKGYIGERIRAFLCEKGVTSAILNFGGAVFTIGRKSDGSAFTVGIRKPEKGSTETVLSVESDNQCVTTSGIYERSFLSDGILYHHILNPETGLPIDNELASVTVITKDGTDGDILSTLLFLLGSEKGNEFLRAFPGTEAIYIKKDGNVIRSVLK